MQPYYYINYNNNLILLFFLFFQKFQVNLFFSFKLISIIWSLDFFLKKKKIQFQSIKSNKLNFVNASQKKLLSKKSIQAFSPYFNSIAFYFFSYRSSFWLKSFNLLFTNCFLIKSNWFLKKKTFSNFRQSFLLFYNLKYL